MSKRFSIYNQLSVAATMPTNAVVAAGAVSSIDRGTPTFAANAVATSPWTGAVAVGVDGNGTTAQRFTGIAKSVSTDTASAAGTVELWLPLPGLLYSGFAKTSSTADTAAEIAALFGKHVVFDLTSTDWTIDAAAADAQVNCVTIVGGDPATATLFFAYKNTGTFLGSSISA